MRRYDRRAFRAMGLMSTILSQLVGPLLLGIFIGRWLDDQYNVDPLFLILCLLLGLASGIYAMLRSINHFFTGES